MMPTTSKQTTSKLFGIPVYKMTKISCKVQENFLPRYFVKHFPAAVLLAVPDIFQH
jgi:hypothetical protein